MRRLFLFRRACRSLDPLNTEATIALAEALAVRGDSADAVAVLDQYLDDLDPLRDTTTRLVLELRAGLSGRSTTGYLRSELQPPLVGRGEILRDLAEWIAGRESRPRVVAFVGEAGIGKTRLMNEAGRIATVHGIRCVEYRSSTCGEERSLVGRLDLLPLFLSLPGAVGCAPESYAMLSALARGVRAEGSIPQDIAESAFRFASIRRAVGDLFEAILPECEVLVSVDDAHTLDRQTFEILLDASHWS